MLQCKPYKEISMWMLEIDEFRNYQDFKLYNLDYYIYIELSSKFHYGYYYGRVTKKNIHWNFPRLFFKTHNQLLQERLMLSDGYGKPDILLKRKIWRDHMISFPINIVMQLIVDFSVSLANELKKKDVKEQLNIYMEIAELERRTLTIEFYINFFLLATVMANNPRRMRQEIDKAIRELIGDRLIICFYSMRVKF